MSNNQQVAVRPPRLSVPANLEEKYGIDPDSWEVLVNATFPSAKSPESVLMALAYCKQRGLDIFRKPIHLVPMETNIGGQKVTIDTVWPGIGEIRITAQRQADFYGYDECEFGPLIEFSGEAKVQKWTAGKPNGWEKISWKGMVPEWAQFTVYKMMHGHRIKLPGPKVYFMETYAPVGRFNPSPNERWCRAPRQMLEKCAEAAALRRAWPDVFGDEATYEEMEGRTMREHDEAPPGNAEADAGPRPTREQFKAKPKEEVVDGEFTEVKDGEQDHNEPAEVEAKAEEVERKLRDQDAAKAAEAGEKIDKAEDKPAETLPSSTGQWEAWIDNFTDGLEDRHTVVALDRYVEHNRYKLENAPEDFQENLSRVVSARRSKLVTDAGGEEGATAGDQSKPAE